MSFSAGLGPQSVIEQVKAGGVSDRFLFFFQRFESIFEVDEKHRSDSDDHLNTKQVVFTPLPCDAFMGVCVPPSVSRSFLSHVYFLSKQGIRQDTSSPGQRSWRCIRGYRNGTPFPRTCTAIQGNRRKWFSAELSDSQVAPPSYKL